MHIGSYQYVAYNKIAYISSASISLSNDLDNIYVLEPKWRFSFVHIIFNSVVL